MWILNWKHCSWDLGYRSRGQDLGAGVLWCRPWAWSLSASILTQSTQDLWELEPPPGLSPILFIPYSLKQKRQVVRIRMWVTVVLLLKELSSRKKSRASNSKELILVDYIAHNWLQGKVRKAVIKPGSGPDNKKRPNKHRGGEETGPNMGEKIRKSFWEGNCGLLLLLILQSTYRFPKAGPTNRLTHPLLKEL